MSLIFLNDKAFLEIFWKKKAKNELYIFSYLLTHAHSRDSCVSFCGYGLHVYDADEIKIHKGDFYYRSDANLSSKLGCNKNILNKALLFLEENGLIETKKYKVCLVIRIVDYASYFRIPKKEENDQIIATAI